MTETEIRIILANLASYVTGDDYPVYTDDDLEQWAEFYRQRRDRLHGIPFVVFMRRPAFWCQHYGVRWPGYPVNQIRLAGVIVPRKSQ